MPTNGQLSGASYPLSIGGKTFKARALSDKDFDELDAYTRSVFLKQIKSAILLAAETDREYNELLKNALLTSSLVTLNSVEGSKIVNGTAAGCYRVGWQMITFNHPQVTLEEFTELAKKDSVSSIDEIHTVFSILNIQDEEDSSEEQEASEESSKSD